ncbi:hypothetical protein FCM35_KLT11396 [Carex littledalei]|uniref:Uncharacterized protein n=1 Tax=Carex littledalei TaxID=544730 RepID=A0A833QR56_9POAL|nr:hypothetical protein FCM35_KLT11396 [Carex littledalei]
MERKEDKSKSFAKESPLLTGKKISNWEVIGGSRAGTLQVQYELCSSGTWAGRVKATHLNLTKRGKADEVAAADPGKTELHEQWRDSNTARRKGDKYLNEKRKGLCRL